ncbi:hypothetical protein L209DRAFT_752509 [Thermothelomyces heterothallicus CBS 203.75]
MAVPAWLSRPGAAVWSIARVRPTEQNVRTNGHPAKKRVGALCRHHLASTSDRLGPCTSSPSPLPAPGLGLLDVEDESSFFMHGCCVLIVGCPSPPPPRFHFSVPSNYMPTICAFLFAFPLPCLAPDAAALMQRCRPFPFAAAAAPTSMPLFLPRFRC